jgi:adenine-specific DNA methylase
MDHTFRQHAFPIKWSYAEMARSLMVSATIGSGADRQVRDELIDLARRMCVPKPSESASAKPYYPWAIAPCFTPSPLTITCGSGDNLNLGRLQCGRGVMDPPYYDNVMYDELRTTSMSG